MQFDSTLIGIFILLIIFVPVIYMIINASKTNKKVTQTLSKISQTHGINLKDIDVIGNLVIGVDGDSKKLVYSTKENLENDLRIVNLKEVKDCRAKSVKESEKTLQWVGLELFEKQGKREIQFYSENDESGFTKDPFVCLQDAKRWESAMKPLLKVS